MRPTENIFTLLRERGIANDNLSDYERMFILQGSCPMSEVPESSRFEEYPLFTAQRECACTEKLGCRKLSSTGVRDDMFNLEPDQTAKQQDWERSATIKFCSFEDLNGFFDFKEKEELYSLEKLKQSNLPDELVNDRINELKSVATKSYKFHICGEWVARHYPELRKKSTRCNLCTKMRALGDIIWSPRASVEKKITLNGNVFYNDGEKRLAELARIVSNCRKMFRSNLLDLIAMRFENSIAAGMYIDEVSFKGIDFETTRNRNQGIMKDINTVGYLSDAKTCSGKSELDQFIINILHKPHIQIDDVVYRCQEAVITKQHQNGNEVSEKSLKGIEMQTRETCLMFLKWFHLPKDENFCAKNRTTGKQYAHPVICYGCHASDICL